MIIDYHKDFLKDFKKQPKKVKERFKQRQVIFEANEFDPLLNNHALKVRWDGYRSINIGGDLRAIYQQKSEAIVFVAIDTHSNLYQ